MGGSPSEISLVIGEGEHCELERTNHAAESGSTEATENHSYNP